MVDNSFQNQTARTDARERERERDRKVNYPEMVLEVSIKGCNEFYLSNVLSKVYYFIRITKNLQYGELFY